MSRNRQCCDGLCQQGRRCPLDQCASVDRLRFAPGVINGPHSSRRRLVPRWLGRIGAAIVRAFLGSCMVIVMAIASVIMGPYA